MASFEMNVNSDDDAQTRHLLDRDRMGEDPAALTAELLRERQAREAGVAPRVPARPRVLLALVGPAALGAM